MYSRKAPSPRLSRVTLALHKGADGMLIVEHSLSASSTGLGGDFGVRRAAGGSNAGSSAGGCDSSCRRIQLRTERVVVVVRANAFEKRGGVRWSREVCFFAVGGPGSDEAGASVHAGRAAAGREGDQIGVGRDG